MKTILALLLGWALVSTPLAAGTPTSNGIPFSTAKATLPNCCFTVCAFLDPTQTGIDSVDRAFGYTKGVQMIATRTEVNEARGVVVSTTVSHPSASWSQFLKEEGQ